MPEITDPSTLTFLNALSGAPGSPPAQGTEITDPATIRMLDASAGVGGAPTRSLFQAMTGLGSPGQPQVPLLGRERLPVPQGFAQGLRDPLDAAAALLAQGTYAAAPQGSGLSDWASQQVQAANASNTAAASAYAAGRGGATGFDPARLIGQM